MDSKIRQYLEGLLAEAGHDHLPVEVREQLIADLNVRLEQRLILAAVSGMSERKQAEFEALTETNPSKEVVEKFVRDNVVNPDMVFKKAFTDFRTIYLGA